MDEVISPTQRPLPDNTEQLQEANKFISPAGLEPITPTYEQLQTHFLDSAATGIGVRMLGIQN